MSDEQRSSQDLPPVEPGAEDRRPGGRLNDDGPDVEGHLLRVSLSEEGDESDGEERRPGGR